jgi:hypothetical protein
VGRVTLKSRFPEIIGTMPRRISANLKEGAERIEVTASGNLNNLTGTLDNSGQVKGGAGEFKVEFGAGEAYYAQWIEFGRKNAPPYPFLVPAAEAEMPGIVSDVSDTLNSL